MPLRYDEMGRISRWDKGRKDDGKTEFCCEKWKIVAQIDLVNC